MRKLCAAFGAYAAIFIAAAMWRWHVWSYGADTGLFTQAIADTLGGFRNGPEIGTHFRYHWTPLIGVLWPLVAVWPSGLALQIAEVFLIGASAFPLYALARTYLDRRAAYAIAGLLLIYPPLLAVAFDEFHENAFYPLVSLALFWAADRARWRAFMALALISALIREEACIAYVVVGLVFAACGLRASRRESAPSDRTAGLLVGTPLEPQRLALAGVALAALNAGALYYYFRILTPSLGGWAPGHSYYDYPFALGPAALVVAIVTHPADGLALLTLPRLTYLIEAFVPLALLPFFSRWSLLAVPGFAGILLSSQGNTWRMGSHYAAMWVPWVFVGALGALVRWQREGLERRVRVWPRVATGICVVVLIAFDPLHPFHYLRAPYPVDASVRAALATVPANARVATHDEWFTQIAPAHRHGTVYFCTYVDYLVYADDFQNANFQENILPEIRRELTSGQTRVLQRFGRVAVYARTPDPNTPTDHCWHLPLSRTLSHLSR